MVKANLAEWSLPTLEGTGANQSSAIVQTSFNIL